MGPPPAAHEDTQKVSPRRWHGSDSPTRVGDETSWAAAGLEKDREERVVVRKQRPELCWEWTGTAVAPGPALRKGPSAEGVLTGLGAWGWNLENQAAFNKCRAIPARLFISLSPSGAPDAAFPDDEQFAQGTDNVSSRARRPYSRHPLLGWVCLLVRW